jgi:hypothetical protein
MSEIKKDPIREALDAAAQKTAIKNQTILEDPFKKGGRIISAKQLDVDRFATYDSKTYGKLGFDPFKDNNKVYNEKTHWSKDVGRAWDGMWKLAGVGFQDTFAFGLTAGSDSSKNFEDVMKNYSSTRGGYTQFWSNTMLSSGYTVGIGLAIAAEEIGLALTTGGLGNIGTSGLVGMQATRAFNKLNRITRSVSHIDEAARLGNIDEAVKFFSMKGLGQNLGKLGQKLNPIGETADFLRKSKLDEFSQFNDLQKVSLGAGAIARDARKLYMTHSESRLEADLAKSDFINKEIQKARLKSPTGELDQDSINQIRTDASNVYNSTYMGNLGLIYATNAITIDNMFKSMRYSNKMFSIPGKFTTALGKDGLVVKAVKGFSGKRALAAGRKAIADFSVKESAKDLTRYIGKNYKVAGANLVKKGLSNSMEGIQELGQDIVSNSVQSYYGRNHAGQQVRGGFLENMWQAASQFSAEDVGASIKGAVLTKDKDGNTVLNQEGLTTFGSGFFMGSIASPFGSSIGYLQKQIVGGGAKAKIQYIFDRENYVKKQKSEYKKSLAKAKQLTATFNAQLGSFLEYTSNPLVTQSEFQEQILDAAQKGDKKRFEDKKHDSFQQGLKHMLKNNSEGMFTDFLEHMVDKFTPEQMNQAMGRNDITADNVAEYKAKLQTKVATIKSLRAKYDQINEQVVPPIRQSDIDRLDESDPEQRKQKLDLIIYKKAWENLKDELLFNNGKITNKAQRLIELEKQLNKESGLSSTEVQAFISKDGLSKEIQILQTQVEANKNLNLKGEEAKKAKEAEFKLEALQNYQKALTAVEEAESAEEPSIDKIEDAYSDLFEAYHDYRSVDAEYGMFYGKEEAEEVKRAISRKSFDAIVDYLDLKTESQALQDIVNTLVDPTSATMWVERNAEMMADLDKNKEKHIANQLYAFQEKAASSEMLTELQEAGIFFDLNELDDLVSKGIMPSKIYNIESNKESSKEEYQKAQDIISGFYKKLTGKTITQDKSRGSKRSLRFKEDKRTVKGLLRQYGIKLGKEIDLSDPVQLERLLRKLKGSEFLTYIDKELLDKVSDSAPRIMFVDNAEFPISVNEDGVFVIDVRYAGSDYKNVAVNFETLVLSALTQAKLNDSLAENEDLQAEVENLMQQAKDAFAKKYPNLDMDKISLFSSTAEFLSESLNNTAYQAFLGEITDTVSGKKESLWKSLMAKIMKAFNKTFEGSVLQRAVSLANMALDESITENINEKADETVTEEEEQLEPVSSIEKNGVKLMEVFPGVWQVTDKDGNIEAFDTKAEAEAYFSKKTKVPKQTVKQTIKEKVTRTIEVGNTEFLKNANDNPELFADFLHPEVVSNNNLVVAEWTQKLVDLGKELDDAKITNWAYGNIRAQVGGRLIIDVTAEIPVFVKKALQNKKANPRVTELQKEIASLDAKIQQLSAQRKITTGSPSVVSAGTEAKRKEILDKWNSKRAWYQKEDRLSEWYKERDKELAALDTNVEAKKAEIERRRQEEIGTKERRSYTDEKGVTTTVTITEEKDRKIARVEVTKGSESAGVYTETYSKDLPNDTIYEQHNADELDYTPVEKLKVEGKRVEKINAKYDAEIADLREIANVLKQRNALQDQLDEEDENIIEEGEETVQQGTKKVKFLMYKSTGTGSTAASLGEWVPLIAIGTNPDGSEWFVKALYQGQDPKFNKYGSSVFADIDRDLKTQEANLFTGIKSTQEIEEEVEREIDVEIDAPEEDVPAQEEVQTEEQELIDAETKLKTEINQKRELLKRVNEQIASSKKIQLRKRMKLDKQKTQLLLDLKDLQEEYDAKFGSEATIVLTATTVEETPVEEEVNLDNTLVITERTPFASLPVELQNRLIDQYRMLLAANSVGAIRSKYKAEIKQLEALNRAMAQAPEEEVDALDEQFGETFDQLVASIGPGFTVRLNEQNKIEISTIKSNAEPSEAEIEAIQKSMTADMSFMKTIIEYNKEQEPEEFVPAPVTQTTVELTDEELAAYNAAEIERGKQLKQQRLDQQKEEARARSRARKQSIVPINAMEREQVSELLKKVLKEDFDILTMADLTYLIDNLLNDSKTFRFKIPDVIAFVNKKKIKLEQDSQIATVNETFADELEGLEPKARAEAVLGYQKDIFDAIAENSTAYNYGILSKYVKSKEPIKVSYNGKSYSFTLRPIELKALALYNKDLFGRSLKTKEDETQFLINIHQVLENVKKQAAYYKKNLKFTGTPQEIEDQAIELFFELKKKGILLPSVVNAVNYAFYNSKTKLTISRSNALSGSIYTLEEREGVAKRKQPKNKLAQDKTTVREFIYESGFMVTSPLFQEALVADWFSNPENRVHPDFITKNIARGKSEIAFYKSFISNKSKYKTADGVGDAAAGDFANEIQDADVYMQEAVNEIFANYKSISQMFAAIAEKIREFQKEEDYGQYESEAEFENWIGTQEAEKAASDFDEYIMSLEFKITTGQLDLATTDYASLTPAQQLLFDQAVEDGLYDATDAEAANDAANQEVEMPEGDMSSDGFSEYLNEIQAKQTAVDKIEADLLEELRRMGDSYPFVPFLIKQIEALENDKNLNLFLAAYRITNAEMFNQFTLPQKNFLNDRLMQRLDTGAFIGQSILVGESPMQIFSYNMADKTVDLVDIATGEVQTLPMEELFKSTDVFEEGQEYTKLNLDTVVNDQEIVYIKEAYRDIFNNFTASVAEFDKLENADLNSQVLEQLTKCK